MPGRTPESGRAPRHGATDWGAGLTIDPARLAALPAAVVELAGDVIAFDAPRAARETRDRQDPLYWVDLSVPSGWVLIGENGQGDEWWLGPRADVWFFDHAHGERSVDAFEPMHLSVTEWLMVGHVLGRFERNENPSADDTDRLAAALDAISPDLTARWPYDLPL